MLTLSLLSLAVLRQALPSFPAKVRIDARPLLRSIDNPYGYQAVLLSDDGRMVFDFPGLRRVALPYGDWRGNERIVIPKNGPSQFLTSSQISHLPYEPEIVGYFPVASPRAERALISSGQLALLRYDVRGPRPNPHSPWPYVSIFCRTLAPDRYLLLGLEPQGGRERWFVVDTKDDRLTVRRTVAPKGGPVLPPRLPAGHRAVGPIRARDEAGRSRLVEGVDPQGRDRFYEWSLALRRWSPMPPPADANGLLLSPRFFYAGGRLFAATSPTADPAGVFLASADRSGWRRVSERTVVAASANGRYVLTGDPRTGEAWLERFEDLARQGG